MSRKNFLTLRFFTYILACSFAVKALAAQPERPNIVYIMTDDHSYQTLSAYGGPLSKVVKTPNMDRIADEGIIFNRCYVTNSLCGPSRATILTGKHSHANGFYANTKGQVFDGSQQTFPKILRQNGYQTAIIGKWHLVSNPTGFDFWEVFPGQGQYYNPEFISMDGKRYVQKGYNSDIVADKTINWLDSRDKNKPFMIMVHFKGVHSEWEPAIRHANMYDNTDFPVPDTFFDYYSTRSSPARNQEMQISKHMEDYRLRLDGPPKSASDHEKAAWIKAFEKKDREFFSGSNSPKLKALSKYRRFMQNYCATLAGVDENIGRILDYLKENNLEDNTLVIYTSDQGFYMGEHGWFDKRFMYEESFKTPLIMRWPNKIKAGSKTDAMVQNLDFAQTILDAAGCPQPKDMQGASLLPIMLSGGETPKGWRNSLYYRYYEWPGYHMVMRHDGVIMGNEKLIDFYPTGEMEYYNLSSDPKELHNRYSDPSAKDRVAALKAELDRLRKLYKSPQSEPYESKRLQKGLQILKENGPIGRKEMEKKLREAN